MHVVAYRITAERRLTPVDIADMSDDWFTDVYGMNFEGIPLTQIAYGYFIVLAVMIGLVVGQLWFFYRRGWLG